MSRNCDRFKKAMMDDLAGELPEADSRELAEHLEICAACRQETRLFAELAGNLKKLPEKDVPRHFFVYEEANARWKNWMRALLSQKHWVTAALAAGMLLTALLAFSNLSLAVAPGTITLSFGRPGAVLADPEDFRDELLSSLHEMINDDSDRLARELRREWNATLQVVTHQQQQVVDSWFSELNTQMKRTSRLQEERLNAQIETAALSYYRLLAAQHQGDVRAIKDRVDQLAAYDRARSGRTNAIMSTLLQLADNGRRN